MLEVTFTLNGEAIKRVVLETDKGNTSVCVLEKRISRIDPKKSAWTPVFFRVYDNYEEAKAVYQGKVAEASYENGNNSIEPNGVDNIFIRGSLSKSDTKRRR